MKDIKLTDLIRVNANLEDSQVGTNKTMIVDFELSRAGKVINRRIYRPNGQRDNTHTWTDPYPKPILKQHDTDGEPLGRITEVHYESLETEAIDHLGGIGPYLEVKRAFDTSKASTIYKVMRKYNLLGDKKWPGLGRLVAKARIPDQDAIQKFHDQRYMTFSAGSHTDAYTCGLCDSEWHNGDICDHRPGSNDEDGNPAIFFTGSFLGREASVVNGPANDTSIVQSISFADSDTEEAFGSDPLWMTIDAENEEVYLITDNAQIEFEIVADAKVDVLATYQDLEDKTVAKLIMDGKADDLLDSIVGETHLETTWLIRIHDALHSQYDWQMRYDDKKSIPTAVFKLHANLHDTSIEKEFRDSLVNGDLDGFDAEGVKSTMYMAAEPPADSETAESTAEDLVETAIDDKQETEEAVNDTIDWFTLDLALKSLVPTEYQLNADEIKVFADSMFIGPDRSFLVCDTAHYEAALMLLDKYKGPGDINKIRNLVLDQGKELDCVQVDTKYEDLKTDYINALKQIDNMTEKLIASLEKLAIHEGQVFESLDNNVEKLDLLITWFDSIGLIKENEEANSVEETVNEGEVEVRDEVESIQVVENPSENSSEGVNPVKLDSLSPYEINVLKRYKELLDNNENGTHDANRYFNQVRRYVSRNFNPNELINLI